jgi:hypothetical protein
MYWDSDGLLKEAAVNELRREYDPRTREFRGLKSEVERTNICKQSNAFDTTWSSTGTLTVATDATILDPEGNSSWRITDTDAGATSRRFITGMVVGATATEHATISLYVAKKAAQDGDMQLFLFLSGGVTPVSYKLDLDTTDGSVTLSTGGTNIDYGVQDCGDWWRVWGVVQVDDHTNANVYIYPCINPASSTQFINVYNAQLEITDANAGSSRRIGYPTSPIINNTAGTTTRSADSLTSTEISWLPQGQDMSFVVECSLPDEILTAWNGEATDFLVAMQIYEAAQNGNERIAVISRPDVSTEEIRFKFVSNGGAATTNVASLASTVLRTNTSMFLGCTVDMTADTCQLAIDGKGHRVELLNHRLNNYL